MCDLDGVIGSNNFSGKAMVTAESNDHNWEMHWQDGRHNSCDGSPAAALANSKGSRRLKQETAAAAIVTRKMLLSNVYNEVHIMFSDWFFNMFQYVSSYPFMERLKPGQLLVANAKQHAHRHDSHTVGPKQRLASLGTV